MLLIVRECLMGHLSTCYKTRAVAAPKTRGHMLFSGEQTVPAICTIQHLSSEVCFPGGGRPLKKRVPLQHARRPFPPTRCHRSALRSGRLTDSRPHPTYPNVTAGAAHRNARVRQAASNRRFKFADPCGPRFPAPDPARARLRSLVTPHATAVRFACGGAMTGAEERLRQDPNALGGEKSALPRRYSCKEAS